MEVPVHTIIYLITYTYTHILARKAMFKSILSKRTFATATERLLPKEYGGRFTVTLIPGDGVGKEITDSVVRVFAADNVPIDWERVDLPGSEGMKAVDAAVQSLRRNRIGLKGIWATPEADKGSGTSLNVALRQRLDIFANVAVFKSLEGVPTRIPNIDFVVIRENTEGEYSGLEHESVPGVVESLKVMTQPGIEKIARFAYDYAMKNNRHALTVVHKANIMKLGDGLFKNVVSDIGAKEYPEIKTSAMIVDNASMQAVSKPHQFDVMLTPSMYGTILGNVGAALVGGPGLVAGANFGREYALFEPGSRHPGMNIAGKNVANPTSLLLSSVLMLRHLGLTKSADRISKAVSDVIAEGKHTTSDIGGNATTTEFTDAVIEKLASY